MFQIGRAHHVAGQVEDVLRLQRGHEARDRGLVAQIGLPVPMGRARRTRTAAHSVHVDTERH